LKPRARSRAGCSGAGTSAAASSHPGGAFAQACAAIASAVATAPRNFSAVTADRAGPA
jgi:hypothetical protein